MVEVVVHDGDRAPRCRRRGTCDGCGVWRSHASGVVWWCARVCVRGTCDVWSQRWESIRVDAVLEGAVAAGPGCRGAGVRHARKGGGDSRTATSEAATEAGGAYVGPEPATAQATRAAAAASYGVCGVRGRGAGPCVTPGGWSGVIGEFFTKICHIKFFPSRDSGGRRGACAVPRDGQVGAWAMAGCQSVSLGQW